MSLSATATPATPLASSLVQEAVDWAVLLRYDAPTHEQRAAFECWREASAAHAAAWEQIESALSDFDAVPVELGRQTLSGLQRKRQHQRSRRNTLQLLGLLAALPLGWGLYRSAPWQAWSADYATAAGERRSVELPDGSSLVLNSGSRVIIAFGNAQRQLRLLAGEILVTTAAAQDPRPFVVQTPQGRIQALGTRFGVRLLSEDLSRVAVYAHAVRVQPRSGLAFTVDAGEGADFGAADVLERRAVSAAEASWERGMLLARNQRLEDVIAELARHRPGVLRCHPAVAGLRISGALSLDDTDASLETLAQSHALHIRRFTRYWVEVGPRG